jgi:Ala-tRNA(Pro) deacylase
MSSENFSDLQGQFFDYLNSLDIKTVTKSHPKSPTVEEWQKYTPDLFPNSTCCKNLFLKEKGKDIYYLYSAHVDTKINLGEFSKKVGLKNLRFSSEEDLNRLLGVEAGTVTPFGLFYSNKLHDFKINVVIDARLENGTELLFHPLTNDLTTSITPHDLSKFIKSLGIDFEWK